MAKELLERQLADLQAQISKKRAELKDLDAKASRIAVEDPDAAVEADVRARAIERLLPRMQTGLQDLVARVVERDAAAEAERIDKEAAEKIAGLEAGYQELAGTFTAWQNALIPLRKARLFPRLINTFTAAFPLENISAVGHRLPEELAAWRLQDTSTVKDEAARLKRESAEKIRRAAQKLYLTEPEPENEPAEMAV